jgi:hypothetical protein
MSSVDLRMHLTNEASHMRELGRAVAIMLPVVIDSYFLINQNGVVIDKITAKEIYVGTGGNLAIEMAHTLNEVPVISFISNVIAGTKLYGTFKRVLSTSALGNTTASNLTWMSGQ